MERRKYLGRAPKTVKAFTSEIIRVDEDDIRGYASLMRVKQVTSPFIVGNGICLYANGYSELNYLPDGEHWQLSAIYDADGNIVEWYVDITKKNAVDEEGAPFCDDLYLDAALMPDGQILIFDEDELKDALDRGEVTPGEFDMAYNVLAETKGNLLNVKYMETLCAMFKQLFTQNESF